ncbi:MAG: general stress protein [Bacteroidetes bacterium]|nr:general stress protein [Bacteroidota bacterium]
MKSLVAVYESHDKAVQAIQDLKKSGCDEKKISLLSKADLIDNHIHVKSNQTAEVAELSIGVTAGAVLGILTGVGVFVIPGLGFLYGAGALVGALAGLDFGVMGAGVVAILTSIGIDKINAAKYEQHLNEGRFLIFVQGSDQEVAKAQTTLHTGVLHLELDTN